jgi:hypothetical protein
VWWAARLESAVVITIDCVECPVRPSVFVIRDSHDEAEHVADGVFVTPALDGLWAKTFHNEASCEMSRIGIDGDVLQPPQPIDCQIGPVEETQLGLVALDTHDWLLLDPIDFSEIQRWRAPLRPHAVVGQKLLIADAHTFTLTDVETNSETTVAAPDAHGNPGYGIVSPDGRYVAIEYRDPDQIMDLWVLDIETMEWTHAPSMPVRAFIKRPEPTWTSDGRLAVLGCFGQPVESRYVLIVWRPGDADLSFRDTDQDALFII